MIPQDVLDHAAPILSAAGIDNTRKEARLLWAAAGQDRKTFDQLLARRAKREPMSHLTGQRAFFEAEFIVTPAVLDPRPETETLVLAALDEPFQSVLDLGTGSGCILISLLLKRAQATGVGADVSDDALKIAVANAARLGVAERCDFIVSNWFENCTGTFDLIVANPPYIAKAEMNDLSPEVSLYEPHLALTDEADGLDAYRAICAGIVPFLKKEGAAVFEIGPTQAGEVTHLLCDVGLGDVQVIKDLDGRDRVIKAKFGKSQS